MSRTYVEALPEGDVHIYPDRVLVITDKQSEEVTEEDGTTHMVYSYEIVDSISPEAYSILQASELSLVKDATLELADIIIGGM